MSPQNPFLTSPSHSARVSVGDATIFLRSSGPPRTANEPVVIIEAGLGGTSAEWVAFTRLFTSARVFSYDRSGYGSSRPLPSSSGALTAQRRCEELKALLEKVDVKPPWVLVGHSYGGVLVREFLLMHGAAKVVGMVIVDSAVRRTKLPEWASLLGGATYETVVGLEKNRVLSDEEWSVVKSDGEGVGDVVAAEEREMETSTESVNRRISEGGQVMGDGRLSVLFCDESVDYAKILAWGRKHGFGSEEVREQWRARLEDLSEVFEKGQRAHLGMAKEGRSRFVGANGAARTHNVQIVAPEIVAEEVRWVLQA